MIAQVVRLTQTEFELKDGSVYKHPFIITELMDIKDFQNILNHCPEFQLICTYLYNKNTKEKV